MNSSPQKPCPLGTWVCLGSICGALVCGQQVFLLGSCLVPAPTRDPGLLCPSPWQPLWCPDSGARRGLGCVCGGPCLAQGHPVPRDPKSEQDGVKPWEGVLQEGTLVDLLLWVREFAPGGTREGRQYVDRPRRPGWVVRPLPGTGQEERSALSCPHLSGCDLGRRRR